MKETDRQVVKEIDKQTEEVNREVVEEADRQVEEADRQAVETNKQMEGVRLRGRSGGRHGTTS